MGTRTRLVLALVVASLAADGARSQLPAPASAVAPGARAARLPLRFEANVGQGPVGVAFVARRAGALLTLSPRGATLRLAGPGGAPPAEVSLRVAGGRAVDPRGGVQLATRTSYFVGDPSTWRSNVPTYARVVYDDVLEGVDLVFHGANGALEYDLIVAPGIDPARVVLEVEGAQGIEQTGDGSLVLHTSVGDVVQPVPRVTQRDGERESVISAEYRVVSDRTIAFALGPYDHDRELVIDPVLAYSTYLGGEGFDLGGRVAVDARGSAYVVGSTDSLSFPTQSAYQAVRALPRDAFLAKLTPAGDALEYATYLGGSDNDEAYGVAIDGAGAAYVTGSTRSPDFPVQGSIQGYAGESDVFVAKLSPSGADLVYSTLLGGTDLEVGRDIATDATGSAYITGNTSSSNFPTVAPLQPARGGGLLDAFVAKLDPSGGALVYSTFFGGRGTDAGAGIAVDAAGRATVVGNTDSPNLPLNAPLQPALANFGGIFDAFFARLSATGALEVASYLGGSSGDSATGVALDSAGAVYIVGETTSTNFPTLAALQPTFAGGFRDAFVTKLTPALDGIVYSTYLGGSRADRARGVAVDATGSAHLTGETDSLDFPTHAPLQATFGGGPDDGFVARLSPAGDALLYATYLGGATQDQGYGVALDARGVAYVAGRTSSTTFPTQSPLQARWAGGLDTFVTAISDTVLPIDAGAADGAVDAGGDAAPDDAGPADAGRDGEPTDAGSDASADAAPPEAGPPDASPGDASAGDAGPSTGPSGAVDSGAPPSGDLSGGGCGCRTAGTRDGAPPALALVAALAAILARRARRGRGQAPGDPPGKRARNGAGS